MQTYFLKQNSPLIYRLRHGGKLLIIGLTRFALHHLLAVNYPL